MSIHTKKFPILCICYRLHQLFYQHYIYSVGYCETFLVLKSDIIASLVKTYHLEPVQWKHGQSKIFNQLYLRHEVFFLSRNLYTQAYKEPGLNYSSTERTWVFSFLLSSLYYYEIITNKKEQIFLPRGHDISQKKKLTRGHEI